MLLPEQVAEIRKRANDRHACFSVVESFEDLTPPGDDVDALLADRDELVRRLAEAEAELEGLREIATNYPLTAAVLSSLPHRGTAPKEDA